jgi:DNA topoisomerase-1
MYELIITEKPNAGKRVAEALADGKPRKENYKGVPFYRLTRGKKEVVVGSAVGHLYGLKEQKRNGWTYPVFDIAWAPTHTISKDAAFTKKYLAALQKLAKEADNVTVATDYDTEGEVIGLNVVRFACERPDARRMRFSTLTKPDLQKAYDAASPTLDWGLAEAGETRHFLDYYYGINLSRALTAAIKAAGMFKILSTGRVQGPALKIVVDREREIKAFKPVPFWQLSLDGEAKGAPLEAWHATDKFWKQDEAAAILAKVKGEKKASVAKVERREFQQTPPFPFDLTSLQVEAYRVFGISPKATLDIAQDLYTNGYISYPRTSSQELPPAIGFRTILAGLAKQAAFALLAAQLLKKDRLEPRNGPKTDPAHPAIFPTGIAPKALEARAGKIYDLIAKRFLATFGEPAVRETVTLTLAVKTEPFVARGSRTTSPGWHTLYAPYVKLEEAELPAVANGDTVTVRKITLHSRETQPPKRYTPSSLVRELEKRGLGTKATRAEIVETLSHRNYIKGESIEVTELGMQALAILEQHAPRIVDEALTRHFEDDMELIREGRKKKEPILAEARDVLLEILKDFKTKEAEIGEELRKTFAETKAAMITVGACPKCKEGQLVLRKGKYGRFVACNKYPDCKTTFGLPAAGKVEVTQETCKHCSFPIITIIKKAKRPQQVCINIDCPSKAVDESLFKNQKCPRCKEGDLVLRKSIYGAFIACNRFPKCMHTQRIPKPEGAGK